MKSIIHIQHNSIVLILIFCHIYVVAQLFLNRNFRNSYFIPFPCPPPKSDYCFEVGVYCYVIFLQLAFDLHFLNAA